LEFISKVHNPSFCYQYFKTATRTLFSIETRSKVKGVPQGVPTTSFIEEVSETLPPTQGTYLALCKQQLVEEFPKSKFSLPSEITQFHVSTEELEHPVPIHNPTSSKSPKLNLLRILKLMIYSGLSRSLVR
jgi:hypothetical protein